MRPIINFLKLLYTIYTAIIFVSLVIITLPFFFIFSAIFKDKALIYVMTLCRIISFGLMAFCGIIYRFHTDKRIDKKRTYVLIANHRSNLDAPVAAYSWGGKVVISRKRFKKYLSEGDNIFIFPEGTRNKTENDPLIPFKDGAFSIAIQTQTPILPMVYYNTDNLMPNKLPLMRPGIIHIYQYPPFEVAGLTEADLPALKQQIYDFMEAKYLEVSGKNTKS
ncbi:MAG: 1-acyl-sn-glycerol-3-phosphate acyltransferase [Bacteroidetes bacterium]|nr:1-acyl-sn-glycerol-3-phosphate acyltransferase [Bacteroidota bacterium]